MTRRAILTLVSTAIVASAPLAGSAAADPPSAAHTSAPGTVVSDAALPAELWIPGTGSARRLTYWTQDSAGAPALSTGAIFVPAGTPPPGGWPVLSWEHGTVGVGDACAPSTAGRSQRDLDYLGTWMDQGYAVVATDYIGLGTPGGHAYLDGRAEANAAIDMVRAARAVDASLAAKWVAIGQSQGGGATVFTAAQATRYAPELDYRGAVATGPASNVAEVFGLLGPDSMPVRSAALTAYGTYVFNGLRTALPDLDLDSYLSPLGKELVAAAETLCYAPMTQRAAGVALGELLARPLAEGDLIARARTVLDVPMSGYDRPLFIGQGTNDTDVPIPLTTKLIADLEAHGVRPEVHIYPGKDHSATMAASLPDSRPFVARLFA
ncbi:prolyl oligopeptidase family serine peptidase [Nocardia otitidiscaviarum]|uniref:Prolyl oligopeptidase family serine peptidase n=1 Tax=Nocardia otitidiscaviarum TaxID=1823 RepID=A0A516NJN7_9NOCA|nr:lipase family protein [Nocardia otitidiscaviarum]MCP9623578.1 prolyl oligopeptidase family serine peptidase [Nocardia otitidiscaviarum]QDP79118.1 prolyl oligopeptidase family serine peptidase [Nocardia otitidiscaviarum]